MSATGLPATSSGPAKFAAAVERRYTDAYRAAGTIAMFGQAVKVVGAIIGVVIVFGTGGGEFAKIGILAGLAVAAIFFVIGIMIAAQGQLLKASLDTAVNSSPFLADDAKASVMALRAR